MPDLAGIDFNSADPQQRKLLRVALMGLFRRERSLAMFLDEELGLSLRDEIDEGPFKEQVWELIDLLAARGRLDDLMRALLKSEEYAEAPTLRDVLVAWSPVSVADGAVERPAGDAPAAPIERILDGDFLRMRPLSWISGIAAIRRRVCLLRSAGMPRATGFLVAPDLVMTAGYVLHMVAGQKLDAVFDFGIGAGDSGVALTLGVAATVVLVPPDPPADRFGAGYTESLDYAVLRLAESAGEQRLEDRTVRGWFDLTNTRERLREGEAVFMLHHPQGGAMSLSEGLLGPAPGHADRFAHDCPTEPGSGGAPLVDATLRLIGLQEMKSPSWKEAVRADRVARDLAEKGVGVSAPPAREAPPA